MKPVPHHGTFAPEATRNREYSAEEAEDIEADRSIDERLADPAPGIPLEDVIRETLARDE